MVFGFDIVCEHTVSSVDRLNPSAEKDHQIQAVDTLVHERPTAVHSPGRAPGSMPAFEILIGTVPGQNGVDSRYTAQAARLNGFSHLDVQWVGA